MSDKETKKFGFWLEGELDDPEFQREYARESLVEDYLDELDELMARLEVSRSELAERLGCSRANITQLMRREKSLTSDTMADLAFALGHRVSFYLEAARGQGGA